MKVLLGVLFFAYVAQRWRFHGLEVLFVTAFMDVQSRIFVVTIVEFVVWLIIQLGENCLYVWVLQLCLAIWEFIGFKRLGLVYGLLNLVGVQFEMVCVSTGSWIRQVLWLLWLLVRLKVSKVVLKVIQMLRVIKCLKFGLRNLLVILVHLHQDLRRVGTHVIPWAFVKLRWLIMSVQLGVYLIFAVDVWRAVDVPGRIVKQWCRSWILHCHVDLFYIGVPIYGRLSSSSKTCIRWFGIVWCVLIKVWRMTFSCVLYGRQSFRRLRWLSLQLLIIVKPLFDYNIASWRIKTMSVGLVI